MSAVLEGKVRAAVAETRERAIAGGYDVSAEPEHGEAGGAKWLVSEPGAEPAEFEGGYVCFCGDVFARDLAAGGMPEAFRALVEHQGGEVLPRGA